MRNTGKKIDVRRDAAPDQVMTKSSGNVFRDLGLPDADERDLKVRLAMELNAALDANKWTQDRIATVLGVSQPQVSSLRNYKLDHFSPERLMRLLTLLNRNVIIEVRRSSDEGTISVKRAA